jgi:predicted ATP-dependent endonuclease of OLD family
VKLTKVQIAGYRSISKKTLVHFDPSVTIILGANDHGKTNLLDPLTHINEETNFDEERDLNWDHINNPEDFPSLEFEFQLSDSDRELLLRLRKKSRQNWLLHPMEGAPLRVRTHVALAFSM